MRLWIGLHLYRLSLNVLHPLWASEFSGAVAVLEDDTVIAANTLAVSMGVHRGMRRRGAQAIAPQVTLLRREPSREQEAFEAAAVAMLQYTPEVCLSDETVVLLDVSASLLAFGGVRALERRIRQTLGALAIEARIGMAPTAMGAWLLARQGGAGRRRALKMSTLAHCLETLPCGLLPAAREHRDWLQEIGCRTVAGLSRLPRAGLQRRTSTALLQDLDRLHGRTPDVRRWISAPASFVQRLEMHERTDDTRFALFAAQHLVERMCGWLTAQHRAVSSLVLSLQHERARQATPATDISLRLAEPAWQSGHLLRLLQERLARVELPAPFVAVSLAVTGLAELRIPAGELFADPGGKLADRNQLLELLVARLGRDQVLVPCPLEDYRPEVANRWQPAESVALQNRRSVDSAVPAALSDSDPFWLLEAAEPLTVAADRPVYAGLPLRLVRGPRRIEAGWWNGRLTARDYFIAEDAQGACYWIYRERDTRTLRWFLQGFFG